MGWPTARLADLLADASTGTWGNPPRESEPEYPVIRSTNIQDRRLLFDDVALRRVTDRTAAKYALEPGDIVVTTSSGSRRHIGKNAIFRSAPDDRMYLYSNFTLRLRTDHSRVEPRYVYHYLNSASAREDLERAQSTTSGLRNLDVKAYLAQEVPVPSLDEQRRIADLLDEDDRLRRLRAEADVRAARILPALFIKMFGDPQTNPMGWQERLLRDVAIVQVGPFGSLLHHEDYVYGGIPVVNPKHIQSGLLATSEAEAVSPQKHAALKAYHLREGDVVMGRRGEMGRCAVVGREHGGLLCGTGSVVIRPNQHVATAHYLAALLSSAATRARLERLSLGQTLPNLNGSIVEALLIPLPPRSLQDEFAEATAHVRALRAKAMVSADTLGETRHALEECLMGSSA